jgi:hypothetical protein
VNTPAIHYRTLLKKPGFFTCLNGQLALLRLSAVRKSHILRPKTWFLSPVAKSVRNKPYNQVSELCNKLMMQEERSRTGTRQSLQWSIFKSDLNLRVN